MSEKDKKNSIPTEQEVIDRGLRVRIKVRAFDYKLIDQATRTIIDNAHRTGAKVKGPVPLPTEKVKYTVNRSTFIRKDAREQFEVRVHKRLIDIFDPKPKTIEELSTLNLPSGVDIEIKM
ncbi:MAG: 30S ribosomal protein S10 [Patescibacteria group bacterium]